MTQLHLKTTLTALFPLSKESAEVVEPNGSGSGLPDVVSSFDRAGTGSFSIFMYISYRGMYNMCVINRI